MVIKTSPITTTFIFSILVIVLLALSIVGFNFPLSEVSADQIKLKHNIPKEIETGKTFYCLLEFTDGVGRSLDPSVITITILEPSGREVDITPIGEEGKEGIYTFSYIFENVGAYYITIRANRLGYISFSDTIQVDAIRTESVTDIPISILASPFFMGLIGIGFCLIVITTLLMFSKKKGGII